jgi:DNA-binding MarR family transcriptional regulator
LGAARRTYGRAIRVALERADYDDIPPNGLFVLGAIARTGAPLSEIITGLGVSKQAAGALVDTLVTRGYLDRQPDPEDRRRLIVGLTARGGAAAEIIRDAADRVDAALRERVPADHIAIVRTTLLTLIELGRADA